MKTCRCGRPTRDNASACDTCVRRFEVALGDIPFTVQELDITITQQRAASLEPVIASANVGIRWHDRAATIRRELHTLLAVWVKRCHADGVARRGGKDGLPADETAAMSRWLMCRIAGLRIHPDGGTAIEDIAAKVDEARKVIFWKKSARDYLGPCETKLESGITCDGTVYADHGSPVGHCDECEEGFTVVIRQAELNQRLEDQLCTAAEIATYAVYLGLKQPREKVRVKVNYWSRHGRIMQRGTTPAGDPRFRYGEVRPLLYAEFSEKVNS